MKFRNQKEVPGDTLIVHVHVPHTGGTSLRKLFNLSFGDERCLMNYEGEVHAHTPQQLQQMRCVSSHVEYGVHRHFAQQALYITAVRNPIDRYRSTYATFVNDRKNPHHEAAVRLDINAFLRLALDSDITSLHRQMHNLQCRLICGEPSFDKARDFIDEKYFLAAPFPRLEDMVKMLSMTMHGIAPLPWALDTETLDSALGERMHLSPESIELLIESEAEDALLYSHVQKAFAALAHSCPSLRTPRSLALPEATVPPLPPAEIRFMGESDALFVNNADILAAKVLNFTVRACGERPQRLLDVGCGYGRLAYGLRRAAYDGSYAGFDILRHQTGWLKEHFNADVGANAEEAQRYRFDHVNRYNERYNPSGERGSAPSLPYAPASFDGMASLSVFTHLYEDEVLRYVGELASLLETGGIWVTTFFCVPRGFTLQDTPADGQFPLTVQVSQHAFVHKADAPLHVIAYTEDFLLALFARHGLEVVDQRKGHWLTKRDSLELQDWFVLRKRAHWNAVESRYARSNLPRCNICGASDFGPGPNGRSAVTGKPPCCKRCGSLERHRVVRQLFDALPQDYLGWRSGLQFSRDPGPDGSRFRRWEVSIYDGENSLDMQQIARHDESYDFLSLSHVLESVPDDRAGFDELCRILSPKGLMHISFGNAQAREVTAEFDTPHDTWRSYRVYGRDVIERFDCARRGLAVIAAEALDPCTGAADTVHLFMKDPADAPRVHAWLDRSGAVRRIL